MTVAMDIKGSLNGRVRKSADASLNDLRDLNKQRIKELQNLKTPMVKASIYLDRWVQSNFKSEGGKVGGWKPFARGGRITDNGIDRSAQLLQLTGRLRASFLPFATNKNAGIGSDLDYSEKHHEGEGRIPERRLLPKRDEVMTDLRRIIRNHVVDAIRVKER